MFLAKLSVPHTEIYDHRFGLTTKDFVTILSWIVNFYPWHFKTEGVSFQFTPEVPDGTEVWALCRPVELFHAKLGPPSIILKQETTSETFCSFSYSFNPRFSILVLKYRHTSKYCIFWWLLHGGDFMFNNA